MLNMFKLWFFCFFYITSKIPKILKTNKIKNESIKRIEMQKLIHPFTDKILKILNINLEIKGIENLPKNENNLYIANHSSIFDPVIIFGSTHQIFSFFISSDFKYTENIPIIGTVLKSMQNIFIDRNKVKDSIRSLQKGIKTLNDNMNLMIFPEGEITHLLTDDPIASFKSGSFKTALKAKKNIILISIIGSEKIQSKVALFGKINSGIVKVIIHPKLLYNEFKNLSTSEISKKCQEIIRKDLINEKITN